MGNLEGRVKKLEKLHGADVPPEGILFRIFSATGECQQVRCFNNEKIVIRRESEETESQFLDRAESEIRTLTGQRVIVMIADDEAEKLIIPKPESEAAT
jgi:hypothetical protein